MKNDFREFYDTDYILHDLTDEDYLMHGEWSSNLRKFVDKVRTRNGKWRYIYPEDLKKKVKDTVTDAYKTITSKDYRRFKKYKKSTQPKLEKDNFDNLSQNHLRRASLAGDRRVYRPNSTLGMSKTKGSFVFGGEGNIRDEKFEKQKRIREDHSYERRKAKNELYWKRKQEKEKKNIEDKEKWQKAKNEKEKRMASILRSKRQQKDYETKQNKKAYDEHIWQTKLRKKEQYLEYLKKGYITKDEYKSFLRREGLIPKD